MIDLQALRFVVASAQAGSFSAAATRFGIKQSTVSRSVQFLEHRLGIAIFTRSTRGLAPTEAGTRFLVRAGRILDDLDALGRDSRDLGKCNVLRLGCQGSIAAGNLGAALVDWRTICPDVELQVVEAGRGDLLGALETGGIDLALLSGSARLGAIRSLSFWSEALNLAVARDSPYAALGTLYWTDLRGAEFLVTAADPGPDIAAMIASRLSGPGSRPEVRTQQLGRENLPALVSGNRVAVVAGPLHFPGSPPWAPVFREVHDAFGATRLDQAVHWLPDNPNPLMRRFLELLAARHARELPPW